MEKRKGDKKKEAHSKGNRKIQKCPLPLCAGAATGSGTDSGLLQDKYIILLLVWQTLATVVLLVMCVEYCRRKPCSSSNRVADSPLQTSVVRSVTGAYSGNVVKTSGGKYETNVAWTHNAVRGSDA